MDMSFLIKAIIVGVVSLAGVSTTLIFKMKKDNALEQAAESIIKDQTGVDVDLTPE